MERHRLDLLSLLAGLLFLAVGLGNLLAGPAAAVWLSITRLWPMLLVVTGIAVLAGIVRRADDR
jgi:ABC-type antimicrobial peptide transport system permease subunit